MPQTALLNTYTDILHQNVYAVNCFLQFLGFKIKYFGKSDFVLNGLSTGIYDGRCSLAGGIWRKKYRK
jgi:hypothetical protein